MHRADERAAPASHHAEPPHTRNRYWYGARPPAADAVHVMEVPGACGATRFGVRVTLVARWKIANGLVTETSATP